VPQAEQHSNQPLSSFFRARSAIIHRTVWCARNKSGVHRTCPVSQWSNGNLASTVDYKRERCKSEVRAESQNTPDMSSVPPDCPVQLKDKGFQRSTAPNPNGRADVARTGPWTVPVRCATEQSGVLSHPVPGVEPSAYHMCAKIHFHTYVDVTSVIYQKTMQ
jgi:hypothetical protein